MDLNRLIQRVRLLLLRPQTQWPVIAAETGTIQDLYRQYVLVLAAIPPVCGFIRTSIIGYAWHGFRVYRLGIGAGLTAAAIGYGAALLAVYIIAAVIDALAPNFGGQSDRFQAVKVAAYSYTATWVAGLGMLLPGVYPLIALAGGLYSIYLLYLGLPATMQAPADSAAGYTAVTVVIAIVIGWIIAIITGGITGVTFSDSFG